MAYRTYINGHEWLGNNEYSEEIFNELKRQGCKFNADWETEDFDSFEVKDLDGLVKATEAYLMNKFRKNPKCMNIGDLFQRVEDKEDRGYTEDQLTLRLQEIREYGYLFLSVKLLEYVGEEYKDWEFYWERDKETKQLVCHYRLLKDGKCMFKAY